ncbi:MAG: hypothetical protein C0408_04845 [Odoribacter sp.]|nr:hypothetical protein [Odoribacter sp.]
MTFNNSRTIIGLRIRIFTATVLLLTYFIITYLAGLIKYPLLGMSDTLWTVLLISLYFIFAFYPMALNYQYVYYSDEGDTIVFRYFFSGIVGGRKNSVEINKNSFAGYHTEKKYFGLMQSVTLFQTLREGVARYPPIYISNLTRKEKAKVLNSLYLHTPKELKDVIREHE